MSPIALALGGPGRSIAYVTSTADRAVEVSLTVQAAVARLAPAYPHLQPHPQGPWRQEQWRTVGGNWFTSLAPGMKTGGVDAHGLIIDDVTGSAEVQRSRSKREAIQRFLKEDALSRLRGVGPKLNMETRRGLDDATTYLKNGFGAQMEIYSYPHVAPKGGCDWRAEGEYLWPERYGPAWHESNPMLIPGDPTWEALHQQNPIPEGGNIIKSEWLSHRYVGTPTEAARTCFQIVIAVDPAAREGETNDPTGIVVAGLRRRGEGHDVLILHVEAERRAGPDSEQRIADLAASWRAHCRSVVVAVEATSVGLQWVPALRRRGLTVIPAEIAGRGDKVVRMHHHLARFAAGEILLPDATCGDAAVADITIHPSAARDAGTPAHAHPPLVETPPPPPPPLFPPRNPIPKIDDFSTLEDYAILHASLPTRITTVTDYRWLAAYTAEMTSVPMCAHDDMWDATSILLSYCASMSRRRPTATEILAAWAEQDMGS